MKILKGKVAQQIVLQASTFSSLTGKEIKSHLPAAVKIKHDRDPMLGLVKLLLNAKGDMIGFIHQDAAAGLTLSTL